MDRCGVLLLYLCLGTSQNGRAGKGLSCTGHNISKHIHDLEEVLLKASFKGKNLTQETSSGNIMSLAFKLDHDFTGLHLNSTILKQDPQVRPSHFMHFPGELRRKACPTCHSELRLICIYFFTSFFFQDITNASLLNNYVFGAQLDHYHVSNLSEPINISFWHNQSLENHKLTCVFWKEDNSTHHCGTWSPEGCDTEQRSPDQVICHCNHLSYFAVLMQLTSAPLPPELLAPLIYISYVGCSISIVSSLLTILLHVYTRKPSDFTTHIHMNLDVSVLLLNVTFLLSSVLAMPSRPESACMMLAATLHYTLLSCLTWMAIEGFNLYLLLLRVYNIYIHRYVLKLCAVGWGVPAIPVLFILAVNRSAYGLHEIPISQSQENSTGLQNISMCWVTNSTVHSVLVMGYGGFTCLFNLVVLVWALLAIRRLRMKKKAPGTRPCRDIITVLGLTVLLGTTWALAFFSFGIFLRAQVFLFTILNSFYGFFLFLWFCFQRCRLPAQTRTSSEPLGSTQMTQ
ncbi:PREDICTED: probable G-protein coupled receptor 114 [Chrysochloris asiatica]|uniref:Probable G-protein coupled receptor 114 n=1 Tax=Chrysochloris asiatica TaxID=185453 RepID=A0A9B0TJH1_CHRAS|nr:PREDICTED: probable G-protein coupled receptor 114 [Chrysochloris asiatica]